jgi:hypothetical protein
MNVDEIDRALEALETEGARAFDALACDCTRTLYVRAEELGGSVGERLLARAEAHLEALRARFHAGRTRVDQALEALVLQAGEQPQLVQALEKGEVVRVARSIRRLRRQPRRTPVARQAWTRSARAGSADAHEPTDSVELGTEAASGGAQEGNRLTRTRRSRTAAYEDSVAELVASYALARATDVVPEGAGPYNALRIASQALDAMRTLSPAYLTVQLNRLEELASLLALPELPTQPKPEPMRTLPKKKSRALKR